MMKYEIHYAIYNCENIKDEDVQIKKGDCIGQAIFQKFSERLPGFSIEGKEKACYNNFKVSCCCMIGSFNAKGKVCSLSLWEALS